MSQCCGCPPSTLCGTGCLVLFLPMSCACIQASRVTAIQSVASVSDTLDGHTGAGTLATATPAIIGPVATLTIVNPSNSISATANLRIGGDAFTYVRSALTAIDYTIDTWIEYAINAGGFLQTDASHIATSPLGVGSIPTIAGLSTPLYLEQLTILPATTITIDVRRMFQYRDETGPVAGVLDTIEFQTIYAELDLYVA